MIKVNKYFVFLIVLVALTLVSCSNPEIDNNVTATDDHDVNANVNYGNIAANGLIPNEQCRIQGYVRINNVIGKNLPLRIEHKICHGEGCSVCEENKDPYVTNTTTNSSGYYDINSRCQLGCHVTRIWVYVTYQGNTWFNYIYCEADYLRLVRFDVNINTAVCPINKKVCWNGQCIPKSSPCPDKPDQPCRAGYKRCAPGDPCVPNSYNCNR